MFPRGVGGDLLKARLRVFKRFLQAPFFFLQGVTFKGQALQLRGFFRFVLAQGRQFFHRAMTQAGFSRRIFRRRRGQAFGFAEQGFGFIQTPEASGEPRQHQMGIGFADTIRDRPVTGGLPRLFDQ